MDNTSKADSNGSCNCSKNNCNCLEVGCRPSPSNSTLSVTVEIVPEILDNIQTSSTDEALSVEQVPSETEDEKSVPPQRPKPASQSNINANSESSENISRTGSLHLLKPKNTDIEETMVEQMEEPMEEQIEKQIAQEIVDNEKLEVNMSFHSVILVSIYRVYQILCSMF